MMRYDPTEVSKALELMKEELSNESGEDDNNDGGDESSMDYNESLRTIGSTRGGSEIVSQRGKTMTKLSSERQFKVDHPHISFGSSRNGSIDSSSLCSEDFVKRIEREERQKKSSKEQDKINVAVSNIFGRKHEIEDFDYFDDLVELETEKTRLETLCEIGDSLRSSISQKSSELKSSISKKLVRSNTPSEKDHESISARSSAASLPKYAPQDNEETLNFIRRFRRSLHFLPTPTKRTNKKCIAITFVVLIILFVSIILGLFIPEQEPPAESPYKSDQEMLLIAERIVENCNESEFLATSSRERCQDLCQYHMCCFLPEGDSNSCQEDEGLTCAIYAGCEILLAQDTNRSESYGSEKTDAMNDNSDGRNVDEGNDDISEDIESNIDPDEVVSESKLVPSSTTSYSEEEKLRLAEEVNSECGKSLDRSRCRDLCSGRFCCFYDENDCVDDDDKMCMVYAGCERYYIAFARENNVNSQSDESLDASS